MKKLCIPVVLLAFVVACSGDVPTGTDELAPDFAVAGASGCVTPHFATALTFVGPGTFSGPITGDLEGTATFVFTPGSDTFNRVTHKNSGTAYWEITGGVLGAVTFETAFENKNLNQVTPPSPFTVWENIGSHRATDGFRMANLTYTGTFSLTSLSGVFDHQGVLCP
jgi:hypothetical protein